MKQKMKYLLFICLSLVLCSVQHVLADDGTALEVPRIREGQEMQEVTVSPNWRDALEPGAIYEVDASEWFEGEGTLTYHWLQEEAIGDLRLDAATGALEFRPWCKDVGKTAYIEVYAKNEAGESEYVQLSIYIDKAQNAPDTEYTVVKDTYSKDGQDLIYQEVQYQRFVFAADLKMNDNRVLSAYLDDQEVAYYLEEKGPPHTDVKIFGIYPIAVMGLSSGEHTVEIIMSGGADIEFPVYVKQNMYNVTYAPIDPEGVRYPINQITCNEGETVILPTLSDTEHYTFAGWWSIEDDPADSKEYTSETPIYSDVALRAKWEPKVYAVTFINGGAAYAEYDIAYGEAIPLPSAPQKAGYRFIGWYSGENGDGTKLEEGTAAEGPLTLYAHWSKTSSGSLRNTQHTQAEKTETEEPYRAVFDYEHLWELLETPVKIFVKLLVLFPA